MNSNLPCLFACLVDVMALIKNISLSQNDQTIVRQISEVLAEYLEEIFLLLFCDLLLVFNYAVDDGR